MEALTKEAEETTLLIECLWRWRRLCFLWDQVVDNNNGGVGGGRWAKGISNENGCVGRGRGIDDTSEGLEMTTEAVGDRWWPWGIYNDGEGVGEWWWAQIFKQRKRRRWRRINDAYKGSETTPEAAAAQQQAWWIGNDNRVSVFFYIALLTIKLSCLCLIYVLFYYCFHQIPFLLLTEKNTISTAIIWKIFLYQMYTHLVYVSPT